MNQTSQMVQVAQELNDFDCWYSQLFPNSILESWVVKNTNWVNNTVVAGHFKVSSEKFLKDRGLNLDYEAKLNHYDLVVYCSELIRNKRLMKNKTVWVQEGMTDKFTWVSKLIKASRIIPPYLTLDTSLNGSCNFCDIYCVGSNGYKDLFSQRGTDKSKIIVTGIPNFDNARNYLNNNFPHKGYVLVATTDMRETFRKDDRIGFIGKAVNIANGRPLIFKLHPNENRERAEAEIITHAPKGTLVFQQGSTNEMIANCDELITQYSTVVYVGIALNKKVHSYFDVDELMNLAPIQNSGASARNIAYICRNFVEFEGRKQDFIHSFHYNPQIQEYA